MLPGSVHQAQLGVPASVVMPAVVAERSSGYTFAHIGRGWQGGAGQMHLQGRSRRDVAAICTV
jgi:hypothetical protein